MNPLDGLPTTLRDYINSLLLPGETVVWISQPDLEQSIKDLRGEVIGLRASAALIALVGILLLCVLPIVAGLPIFLVAAYLVYLLWKRSSNGPERVKHTANVITNQRIFIARAFGKASAAYYEPKNLTNMEVTENAGGGGSILFYKSTYQVGAGDSKSTQVISHGFFHVPAVREAERHLRALLPIAP